MVNSQRTCIEHLSPHQQRVDSPIPKYCPYEKKNESLLNLKPKRKTLKKIYVFIKDIYFIIFLSLYFYVFMFRKATRIKQM